MRHLQVVAKPSPKKKPRCGQGSECGGTLNRSVHKRIIGKVLGGHLLRGFHHFERINLDRCGRGNTGLAVVGIAAHPATQATMKAAAVTAKNVLAI